MHPDKLPIGTPIEGWGGTAGPERNQMGLWIHGPQPARTFYARLVVTSTDQPEPLPPALAQLVLTREAQRAQRLRQLLLRAAISAQMAQLPPEAIRKRLTVIKHEHRTRTRKADVALRQG